MALLTAADGSLPVLGFIAPSGTGKTTLLTRIIALLQARGLRVGVIKQARDDFDVDFPGKDSYELRKAGVERLLLASERKSALICEHPQGDDPQLQDLLALLDSDLLDLVLVEGFSQQAFAKIELYRQGGAPPRYPHDPYVIALATDHSCSAPIPVLDINDPAAVANFVVTYIQRETEIEA